MVAYAVQVDVHFPCLANNNLDRVVSQCFYCQGYGGRVGWRRRHGLNRHRRGIDVFRRRRAPMYLHTAGPLSRASSVEY